MKYEINNGGIALCTYVVVVGSGGSGGGVTNSNLTINLLILL